jgi:hypothetical protein
LGKTFLLPQAYNQLLNGKFNSEKLNSLIAFLSDSRLDSSQPFTLPNLKRFQLTKNTRVEKLGKLVKDLGLSAGVALELICVNGEYKIASSKDKNELEKAGFRAEKTDEAGILGYIFEKKEEGFRLPDAKRQLEILTLPPNLETVLSKPEEKAIQKVESGSQKLTGFEQIKSQELRRFVELNALLLEENPLSLIDDFFRGKVLLEEVNHVAKKRAKILRWSGYVGFTLTGIITAVFLTLGGATAIDLLYLLLMAPSSVPLWRGEKAENKILQMETEFRRLFLNNLLDKDAKEVAEALKELPHAVREKVFEIILRNDSDKAQEIRDEIDLMLKKGQVTD